jgi:hypothetical protein
MLVTNRVTLPGRFGSGYAMFVLAVTGRAKWQSGVAEAAKGVTGLGEVDQPRLVASNPEGAQ